MVRKWKSYQEHEAVRHGTSIGKNPKFGSMNKNRRRSFKQYRGQGKGR